MLLDGAVEVMMTLAQENDEELKVMCSATLTNLSCYEEAHEILEEKGVIEVSIRAPAARAVQLSPSLRIHELLRISHSFKFEIHA